MDQKSSLATSESLDSTEEWEEQCEEYLYELDSWKTWWAMYESVWKDFNDKEKVKRTMNKS